MTVDAIAELGGLRRLARSLVHGDADADDLLQDAAVAALEHPPELDRPVRPWLAKVIVNRWRMNRRAAMRRHARELAAHALDDELPSAPIDPLERAQTLRKLGDAVVALAEPYRHVVIACYFDGKSSTELATELGVPAVTVRTRLHRALEMLRSRLDESAPRKRWQRALVPIPVRASWFVHAKPAAAIAALVLLAVGGVVAYPRGHADQPAVARTATASPRAHWWPSAPAAAVGESSSETAPERVPGRRATVEILPMPGGLAGGRVINWSTGEGVPDAELTFTGDAGAVSIQSGEGGAFELHGARPGPYTLQTVAAPGFLPYAPEYLHSSVRFDLARDRAVRGLVVYLFPALDYHGLVVDAAGKPVASAKITLAGTPEGEQTIDRLVAAWTSDREGAFTFHAADGAVLEAQIGDRYGWARLDGNVAITKHMKIAVARVAPRDATITGKVVDDDGKPLADALVRADPEGEEMGHTEPGVAPRATAYATTGENGTYELRGLDRGKYIVSADAHDRASTSKWHIAGGTRDLALVVGLGAKLAGRVATKTGEAVPAFTLLVYRKVGAARELIAARSIVDTEGHFDVRVEPGQYELIVSAAGWAPSPPTPATAPSEAVALAVGEGAKLSGTVVSATTGAPIPYARVSREGLGGGASALPANAGTVTASDGTFVLDGIPSGPLALSFGADGFDARIEAGMTAEDGVTLPSLSIALSPIVAGQDSKLDYVGIGVKLTSDGDNLLVKTVYPNGGAQAAGIVVGDHIATIDGTPVADLGEVGAVARIRGLPNTTVALGVVRPDGVVTVVVTRRRMQT